jgi:hypothetical protein
MCLFAIGIEDPLDMTVQRLHEFRSAIIGGPPRRILTVWLTGRSFELKAGPQ